MQPCRPQKPEEEGQETAGCRQVEERPPELGARGASVESGVPAVEVGNGTRQAHLVIFPSSGQSVTKDGSWRRACTGARTRSYPGEMTAPDALPPSVLPSTAEVRQVMSALLQRYFSRETHARLLDADVTGGVLTVVAWQAGPSPDGPGRVIAHRTDLRQRLVECRGDLEAVLMDALQFDVFEPSAPGRAASGAGPAWLLERYPEATWYG